MKRWQNWLKKIEERKGFILVDAMVAVLILAIGLAALALLYTGGIGTLHHSSVREKAIQVAAERLEILKNVDRTKSLADINELIAKANANPKVTFPNDDSLVYTATITPLESSIEQANGPKGDRDIYLVTIKVTWPSSDPQGNEIDLFTYVTTKDS